LRDEIRAILWIIDQRIAGPVNLVSPEPLKNCDFTRVLAHELRRPALARAPAFALKIALGSDLATGAVLASQRVLPRILGETGFSFEQPTAASIISSALTA